MRNVLVLGLACFLGLVIQATAIHSLAPSAIAPDFLLATVVYLALSRRDVAGSAAAFLIGLCGDLASARFLGPNAAGSVLAYYLAVRISSHLYADRPTSLALLAFLASLVRSVSALTLLVLHTRIDVFRDEVLFVLFAEACLTAIVTPLVVRLLHRGQVHTATRAAVPMGREMRRVV